MAKNGKTSTSLVDFEEFFGIPKFFYKQVGMYLYIDGSITTSKQKKLEAFLFVTGFLNLNLVLWMEIMDMMTASILDLNAILILFMVKLFGEIKVLIIRLKRNDVNSFIDIMKKQFPKTPEGHVAFDINDNLHNMLRFERVYLGTLLTGAWCFNLLPIIWSTIEYALDSSNGFGLRYPYYRWYPFQISNAWIYTAVYFQQMHVGCMLVNCYVGIDGFLFSVVSVLLMNFRYIHKQLRSMVLESTDQDLMKLKALMNFHQMTLSAAELTNSVFSGTLLLNFLASIVIICLSGFQATSQDVPYFQLVLFFLVLSHELVQTAVISYLGQMLMDYVSSYMLDISDLTLSFL